MALERVCSKHLQESQNTTSKTHAVFGESAHCGSEPFNFLLCKPDSSANLGTEALQITVNYVPSIFQIREIEFSPFLHFPPLQPPPFPLVACSVQSKGQHFNYQASTTS